LLLAGAESGFEKRQVIAKTRERFGIDPSPFEAILDLREGKRKPRDVDPSPLFESYLVQVQTVINAVDQLEK
jgi:hypothetical protein